MNKKKEFNGQYKSKIKDSGSKRDTLQPKKFPKKEIPNKLKVNLSSSLKYITKKKNQKKFKNINNSIYPQIISKNLQKYNSNSEMKNIMLINNLINCKSCHFLAIFKDYLITDYVEEFLRRIYFLNESIQRLPKLHNYYKNYLQFFCRPTFIDSFSNDIIKNYGDLNAENFYKNNLEKKRPPHETKRILDKKIIGKDLNKNNNNDINEDLIKTVFTKSIKNSIDNINVEDSTINNKKSNDNNIIISDFSNKIQKDPLTEIWESDNNLISEGNSLLLMINEIKEIQNNQKIPTKSIKIGKNISLSKNSNYEKPISEEISYKTLNTDKNNIKDNNKDNNKDNKFNNILKSNTYTKYQKFDSISNMVYSPKSKKNIGFSIKKDKKDKIDIDKKEKLLSPKNKNLNANNIDKTNVNNKNTNSIVVNINININTNQNNNNNNINNSIKSPIHNINKKRYPLSPLSPLNFNILNDKEYQKHDMPLSSVRNKEKEINKQNIEETNYIKISKKKKDYSSLLLSNKRNKKIVELNKIKPLNSIENNDLGKKQNYSCNKDILSYNKEAKELINKNNYLDKNVYFSPKKIGYKSRYTNSMKELENINELNGKKFVYHKKQNNSINSPLSKKAHLEKKYFSYKRLDSANSDMNIINNYIEN